jgi:hypothetical protein
VKERLPAFSVHICIDRQMRSFIFYNCFHFFFVFVLKMKVERNLNGNFFFNFFLPVTKIFFLFVSKYPF